MVGCQEDIYVYWFPPPYSERKGDFEVLMHDLFEEFESVLSKFTRPELTFLSRTPSYQWLSLLIAVAY